MFKLPSEETASVEHQPHGGTFFVAPVVTGIEAEAEVRLFGGEAEVRANLDVISEGEVVGAFCTRKANVAVDFTIANSRHDREREVRAHLEAVGVERLGDLHTNREFDRRRIGIFNRSAAGVVLIAVRVAERCADAGSNRLDS